MISNIGNKPGESRAVHALVPATWLSCVHPQETLSPNMAATVDQIAAQHIGQETPYPSLEVATAQGHGVGSACERGYGCSYSGTLSFSHALDTAADRKQSAAAVPAPVRLRATRPRSGAS